MSEAPANPPVVSRDGSHWEGHGGSVYHLPNATERTEKEEWRTTASASVYSYSNPKFMRSEKTVVLLHVNRQPFTLSLDLAPDDADRLAAALQGAAAQARAVRKILADRAAAAKGEGAAA